ncbi:ATE1 [Lepeophtheirus salmonis]|uniref:Arginyl-tRNA--protein transferase 1 n=1 Tax=Lepeophtheirus salmonis TaxID=72036 RepID=A0A7R8CDU3_LEPSM|nr:ATE1 [Lepeophtheirus salmonis]CAF2752177.1 ATE1 [Lepeophtheirus salmonis]
MSDYTIIEYFGEREGHFCGYCRGKTSNISYGMMAYALHPSDYKALMDRGWRRSGKYVYKPSYGKSCCAQYTIRSLAESFSPSKSQKKVLKKFIAYLKNDKKPCSKDENPSSIEKSEESPAINVLAMFQNCPMKDPPKLPVGPNPNLPLPIKAKKIRIQNKVSKGKIETSSSKLFSSGTLKNSPKSLEHFVDEIKNLSDPIHKFETRLVPAYGQDPVFKSTLVESHAIFRKYQMAVHHDLPEECTMIQFCRFLCSSSLIHKGGYGAYHLQYLLDGKIFCVGAVDILPDSVSSVYLYYDPDFGFLSPGTLSALWELGLLRAKGFHASDELSYYYMGFYIHTCPKMRYKGHYSGSQLLCLESMNWFPFQDCISKLDSLKYSRFDPNPDRKDNDIPINYGNMLVLFRGEAMTMEYILDKKFIPCIGNAMEYAKLVGKYLMERMLLYRESEQDAK